MSILDPFVQQFNAAVANFDAKAAELDATESALWEVQTGISGSAEMMQRWQVEMDKVIQASASVQAVRGTIETVAGWWQNIKSTLGITTNAPPGTLAGLGVFPAAPWSALAIVAGGAAAIAAVIYSAGSFIREARRYALQQENIVRAEQGLPPLEDIAPDGSGFFDGAGETLKYAILGAALLLVLPHLKKG